MGRDLRVPDLSLLNGRELPIWLPALPAPPAGWVLGRIDADQAPTRITLHRNPGAVHGQQHDVITPHELWGELNTDDRHASPFTRGR